MRQSFFFLWVLALSASASAWLFLKLSLRGLDRIVSRRRISGCELARQILDREGLHSVSVIPRSGAGRRHSAFRRGEMDLEESVYHGLRLRELALALHETGHLLNQEKFLVSSWIGAELSGFLRVPVAASWLFILMGMALPFFSWMLPLGQFLFVTVFFLAAVAVAGEWEMARRTSEFLHKTELLEVDEVVRLGRAIQALRWASWAELFTAPLSFFARKVPLTMARRA